jgi:hypothetical protein
MSIIDLILSDYSRMASTRSRYETEWRQLYRFLRLDEEFCGIPTPDTQKKAITSDPTIIDDTGVSALDYAKGGIFTQLMNPASEWLGAGLLSNDLELANFYPVKKWLEYVKNEILTSFKPAISNFYQAAGETLLDLLTIGFGVHYSEHDQKTGRFLDKAIHPGEIFILRDNWGELIHVIRAWSMTKRDIMAAYPQEGNKARTELSNAKDTDYFNIIHSVKKNEMYDPQKIGSFAYNSVHILEKHKLTLRSKGYYTCPYAIPVWSTASGQVYPKGPGHKAKRDIAMLQVIESSNLTQIERLGNPTTLVHADLTANAMDFHPNGLIYGGIDDSGKPMVQYISGGGDVNSPELKAQQVRERIREKFMYSILKAIEGKEMTATEFLGVSEEKIKNFGPHILSLQHSYLSKIFDRRFSMLQAAGKIPPAPPELVGQSIVPIYESPLAKLLKVSEARNLLQFTQSIGGIAQLNPEVLDNINPDAMVTELSNQFSISTKIMRSSDEVAQIRQARVQQMQQQQGLEQANTASDIYAKVSHAEQAKTLAQKRTVQ